MEINATILGQAITFAILVLFTMKFVWPPLNNMLEERARKIADGLTAAQRGQQELADAQAKIAQEMQQFQKRATEIIANADKRAQQIVEEAVVRASDEANKVLLNANAQVKQEFMRSKESLRSEVAVLAMKAAKQILQAEIDQEKHKIILENIKAEL